jgi:prepilin-type N-terminal cleavage/methylation domain-containing protein
MHSLSKKGFTLIELLVVIAIIAILTVVVILSLNPAELLRQSRDANRVSDIATMSDALNVYSTDLAGNTLFNLGNASNTYPSTYDPSATSTAGDQCQGLSLPSLNTSTGQSWQCAPSSTLRTVNAQGWLPVNFSLISSGPPIGDLPIDPTNQTSTGLFYAYNTNGTQFEVTADLESQKYKTQYGNTAQTSLFPEVISGGIPTISALYNPSGLVGYWAMNEGSGSSTIDSSGNGNNGTWAGTPIGTNSTYYTGGKVGNYAGDFNGTNDYVNIPSSTIYNSSSVSVFAWVNLSVTPATYDGVVDKGEADSVGNWTIGTRGSSNGYIVGIYDGSTKHELNTPLVTTGSWHLVGITYNGTTLTCYQDGTSCGTVVAAMAGVTNITDIGKGITGGEGYFPGGSIDEVRIYNRALSAAEVLALYNAEK